MTIPASQIAKVLPAVLAAGGSAIDLNGMILTQSTLAPVGQVVPFSVAADVSDYFGPASIEYSMATIYFNGFTNRTASPGTLYFAAYPATAVAAFLRSASVTMTLVQLKALTAGVIALTVNGVLATSTSINLSAATSFSNAAALISTAFGSSVVCTWNAVQDAFVLTSPTTGAASTITAANGALATSLGLTTATGATVSNGAVAGVPGTAMDALIKITQNWALFASTFEPSIVDKTSFSAWASAQAYRYAYVGFDTDVNAKIAGSTEPWGYAVSQAAYDGSILIYGDQTHAAFVLGCAASLDFTRLNGRKTFAFLAQAGLLPSVSNADDANALIANGYNFYGAYATANETSTFFYPGSISGTWKWADSYVNQIWLNANFQTNMLDLMTSAGDIPYNAAGYAMIDAALAPTITAGLNFGAIRVGTTIAANQVQQIINIIGSDISQSIINEGYYFQIVPATAQIRAARTSPSMTILYADGGAIQQMTLSSVEVQ